MGDYVFSSVSSKVSVSTQERQYIANIQRIFQDKSYWLIKPIAS